MKCNYCGAEHSNGANFCSNCGKPIQLEVEEEDIASASNRSSKSAQEQAVPQTANNSKTVMLLGVIFSAIAFVGAIVLFSIMLANNVVMLGHDALVFIPAFGGLAFGIYAMHRAETSRDKLFGILSVSFAGFAIFYGFLTYCILWG